MPDEINIIFKLQKRHVLLLGIIILLAVLILLARGDLRGNLPKVLPVGTEVRAIVLNFHGGQADLSDPNNNTLIMFVEFQSMNISYHNSETHYVEAVVNLNNPTPNIRKDLELGLIKEAQNLKYDLKEIIMLDFSKIYIRN